MDITLSIRRPQGRLAAIPSKSEVHRLLICAALSKGETRLELPSSSQDIDATLACLRAIGAEITGIEDGILHIMPIGNRAETHSVLDCRESGSTLRFLLPVAAALGLTCRFEGSGRLPQRPLQPLLSLLEEHGCAYTSETLPLSISGKLQGGSFRLPGDVSSQYFTGLLLALPILGGGEVFATTPLQSRSYVEITADAMRQFGAAVVCEGERFTVPASGYVSPGGLSAGGDWSNAAFWLCLGALGGPVTVSGLRADSAQGDRKIAELLREFGADVKDDSGGVTVSSGPLRGIDIDASDIPDLVPILAVVAAAAEGETRICNAGRLRLKESDRLKAVAQNLKALGADILEHADGLLIRGGRPLRGAELSGWGDHRMVMSAAIASALADGPVTIRGAEAVQKSYPGFFADFKLLGGEILV